MDKVANTNTRPISSSPLLLYDISSNQHLDLLPIAFHHGLLSPVPCCLLEIHDHVLYHPTTSQNRHLLLDHCFITYEICLERFEWKLFHIQNPIKSYNYIKQHQKRGRNQMNNSIGNLKQTVLKLELSYSGHFFHHSS